MAEVVLQIAIMNDLEVLEALRSVATECKMDNANCFVRLAKDHRELQVGSILKPDPALQRLLNEKSRLIYSIRLHIEHWSASVRITRTESRADELFLNFPNDLDQNNAVTLLVSSKKNFRLFDSMANVERILGPEIAEFYERREEGLHRLEQLTGKIIEQNEDYRKKLEIQFEERLGKLETQFNERRELLETELNLMILVADTPDANFVRTSKRVLNREMSNFGSPSLQHVSACRFTYYSLFSLSGLLF